MTTPRIAWLAAALLALAACDAGGPVAPVETVLPEHVELLDGEPTQKFAVVKPLRITIEKRAPGDPNPTEEVVRAAMRAEAARLGADAVFGVQITGVQLLPSGGVARTGTGTAVNF